jgi:hypothetical protein
VYVCVRVCFVHSGNVGIMCVCVYVVSKIPLGTPRDPFDRGNGSEGR